MYFHVGKTSQALPPEHSNRKTQQDHGQPFPMPQYHFHRSLTETLRFKADPLYLLRLPSVWRPQRRTWPNQLIQPFLR